MALRVSNTKTEEMIKRNWKYSEPPLVSIRCTTYNHEPYIRDAIEGFLMQETDFPFEIIIHDDASTDGTVDIIREYETRYPKLIKPIYQIENQYSKGSTTISRVINKRIRGKFVALCEGDDFWTDPLKLQIQIDEMRKHPECDISFHPATRIYQDRSLPDKLFGKHRHQTEVIPLSEVIRGGGDFMPTTSIVISQEVPKNLPEWYYKTAPIGDLFWQIFGSKRGGALFIDRNMAVYRAMVPGSWSKEMSDKGILYSRTLKIIESLEFAKEEINSRACVDINYLISGYELKLALIFHDERSYQDFTKHIVRSWRAFPFRSRKQLFLFWGRSVPRVALFLYRVCVLIKRTILRNKQITD